ncbi:MAG TPA: peptide chain release factor-like protein, partial [Nitrosopumilaceae archaeon]|nr:peptide chain release factor-like protein [Nitrosopumilaceae archaeon]
LFSITAKDCDWSYYVGPGDGGQKKQKTHSAVMCTHRASGAQGRCHDSRSQGQNKKNAFERMANTKEFKAWHKIEIARRTGETIKIEEEVRKAMNPENIRTEVKDENGKWTQRAIVDSGEINES